MQLYEEVLQEIPHLESPPVLPSSARKYIKFKPSNWGSNIFKNRTNFGVRKTVWGRKANPINYYIGSVLA